MSLWARLLEVYDRPGVAEACLTLQDEHGQQVSLLLWAGVLRPDDAAVIARAAAVARDWDAAALAPLRAARRAMKVASPPIEDAGRILLREGVKAAELDAERLLVEALERLAPAGAADPAQAMAEAARGWGRPAPSDGLLRLAAMIG
ncbi:MAG: TIGR02444 family protein [Phenylobacterium sp.]